MQRAAVYARYSTDLQSERSVDDQFALCREFAARNGCSVIAEYADKARSGTSILGRDGLLSLMDDARAGKFSVVIVEALDRLSRDQEDLAGLHKRLSFAGVQIIAVHDGKADAIQVGLRGLMSTLFVADLKHKIRRGMAGVVREGRHAGGRAYGYRPTPGQPGVMQVYEPEAEIVRRIFAEAIAGRLPREIAAGLNADGVPPARGAHWNASSISGSAKRENGMLRNPLYIGKIVWNRQRMIRDPETGRRIGRSNDEGERREVEAPHLAIVDREAFDQALTAMSARAKLQRGGTFVRRPKRLLSGLLRCGHCGGGMSVHDRVGSAIRIRCSRSVESGVCRNDRRYRLDRIETAVIDGLREQLAHPEALAEYVRVYREERRDEAAKIARERSAIERRIADLTGQMDRLMQAMARGVLPIEAVEAQYTPLKMERDRISAELAASAASPVVELHPHAAAQYRQTIDRLADRLNQLNDRTDADAIAAFRALVDSVVVHDMPGERVEIEIVSRLAALMGAAADKVGGRVVAEERFRPSPQLVVRRLVA